MPCPSQARAPRYHLACRRSGRFIEGDTGPTRPVLLGPCDDGVWLAWYQPSRWRGAGWSQYPRAVWPVLPGGSPVIPVCPGGAEVARRGLSLSATARSTAGSSPTAADDSELPSRASSPQLSLELLHSPHPHERPTSNGGSDGPLTTQGGEASCQGARPNCPAQGVGSAGARGRLTRPSHAATASRPRRCGSPSSDICVKRQRYLATGSRLPSWTFSTVRSVSKSDSLKPKK